MSEFKSGNWQKYIDVRDFIARNYTPYDGDESFLAPPTARTKALWDEVSALMKEETARGGVYDIDTHTISGIDAYAPGYIDREKEQVVGLQTAEPLCRAIMPFGGMRMVRGSLEAYGRELDPEIEKVFAILRQLREQKVGIVFISHKLREVMEICDSYTVLRDGVMVASGSVKDVTTSDLARFMVGHDVRTEKLGTGAQRGEERLSLHGVTQEPYFRNVDLTAYAGEVLGVTGLLGDGRSELFSAVFGAETVSAGEIRLCGNPVRITSTWQAKQLGLAYVPRNRKENGIIKDMSILENGTIVSWRELMRHGLLDHARQRAQFEREKAALHIKMGKESDSITSLSGGNQQKVVLAKWLSCKPKVLILDNPTQGVDVGAKEEIYDIILKLAKEGVAVIVLSSEAQEVIRVCDRALVMYHGAIVGEVRGETMTEHEIMRLATGG